MQRFVIARHCNGGIGDHLSCLIGSWWLAKRTGRTLVIDWRGSRFNPDSSLQENCFRQFFNVEQDLAGVTTIADSSVSEIDYPAPLWPTKWTTATLRSPKHQKHTAEEISAVNHLVTSTTDPTEPTVAINQWVEPPPPRAAVMALFEGLRPTESITRDADMFWNKSIGSEPAIGIHLRHGNGENVGARAAYWLGPVDFAKQLRLNAQSDVHGEVVTGRFSDNMPDSLVGKGKLSAAERRFCRIVAAEFSVLKRALNLKSARPLLFCDSTQIIETMKDELPGLVACPKYLPPPGSGPLHQVADKTVAEAVTHEMLVELELMNRCFGLLYMDSGFSIMARTRLNDSHQVRLKPSLTNRIISKVMARL